MGFGNIGIGELMMIFLIIMMVFGPKRMPGIARDMGKFLRDFRRETNAAIKELKDGIEPINVGIFDEPDASSPKAAGGPGNGAAAPLPGVAAAGEAGVVPAPVDPLPSNGSRKSAARKKTSGARKPARVSTSTTARRKTPASGAGRKASSAGSKKRPTQKAPKAKSSSSARARASRKR